MATNNRRDVTLGIGVETSGEENIKALASAVRGLAKEGDPAAARFLELATALDKASAGATQFAAAEKAAAAALAAEKSALAEKRDGLARLKLTTDDAGRATAEFKAKVTAEQLALIDGRQAVRDKESALRSATTATIQAAAAEKQLVAQAQAVTAAHREATTAAAAGGESLQGLATKYAALAGSLTGVAFAAKPLYDLAVQSETLHRVLTQIEGSSAGADKQIEFLRDTANKAGVSVGDLSDAYVRFSSAARSSGISANVVNQVFAATTRAAGNLGLSAEKVTLILDALGQMASKGVVSMEELRQQLGDSLPGALGLLAKGLGLTQAELTKLVESGQLLSRDALPALAIALTEISGKGEQVEGLSASFNRLKNTVYEAGQSIIDGPIGNAAGAVLGALGGALRDVAVVAVSFNQTLAVAGKTIALVAAAATGSIGSFKQFKSEFAEIIDDAATKIAKFEERAYASGTAATKAGADAAAAAQDVSKSAQAYSTAGQAAAAATGAVGTLGTTTAAGGVAATNASVSWAKLTVDYANLTTELERQVKVSEKVVAAKKDENDAALALIRLGGNVTALLQAEATAAESNAVARADLTAKREREVEVLKAQLAAETALSAQLGDPDGARAKQILAIQKTIETKTAEAQASVALTEAARTEASVRALAVKGYGDQSAALDELKASYEFTRNAAAVAQLEFAKGIATSEDVAAANRRSAAAEHLYYDALNDTVAALARKNERVKIDLSVTEAKLRVEKANIDAEIEIAQLQGNAAAVVEAQIRGKQVEIKIIEAKIVATKLESQAIIANAEATKAALIAEGNLTDAKRLEIEASIANAKVKALEADASGAALKVLQAQIDALRQYGTTSTNARGASTTALGGETSALDANTAAQDRNNASLKKYIDLRGSASRSIDINNARSTTTPNDASQLIGNGINGGFGTVAGSDAQLNIPSGYFFDKAAFDRATQAYFRSIEGLTTLPGNSHPPNAQDYVKPNPGQLGGASGGQGTGSGAGTPLFGGGVPIGKQTFTPSAGTSHTVTVNVTGGTTSTIKTASPADSQALVDVLKQLESAARSSGTQTRT